MYCWPTLPYLYVPWIEMHNGTTTLCFHHSTRLFSAHVCTSTCQCLLAPDCVQVTVPARVSVCPCGCVCRPSSLNIVLCSSGSSSSDSAVAARSTVYFPSWRTTSYQISRHCLRARCPTTHSQKTSRPLSSRPSTVRPLPVPNYWLSLTASAHSDCKYLNDLHLR